MTNNGIPGLPSSLRQWYLERIGYGTVPDADLETLFGLQDAHLRTVPFENLDIRLGVVAEFHVGGFVEKIVTDRRGGICYELNGAFAALLVSLGFEVELLEARVYDGEGLGIPFDHLALRVKLDGVRLLADVGFGAFSSRPLLLAEGPQIDSSGTFELRHRGPGEMDVFEDGNRRYRLYDQPRRLRDFASGWHFHHRSPLSHLTGTTLCSLRTDDGRVTIRDRALIETRPDGRHSTRIAAEALPVVLHERFGIDLPASAVTALSAL